MKKKIYLIGFVLVIFSISVKSQIYTPDAIIQGSSNNNSVGIGIASPTDKLHIVDNGNTFLNIETSANQSFAGLKLTGIHYSDKATSQIYMDYYGATGYHGLNYISGRTGFSNHWFKNAAGGVQMCITNNGYVGIGISNPTNVFQVGPNTSWNSGTVSFPGDLRITGYSAATPYAFVQARDNSGTNSIGLIIRTQNAGSINNAFFVMPSGNVGIGCSNPTVKLAVNGKIQATEVEIKSAPCSDFVFEKDYKLTSLYELEKFVTVNKHLPEVPSAKEFQENGYSVGQFDDLLLRKVEELTLYVIELKKENDALKQAFKSLNK